MNSTKWVKSKYFGKTKEEIAEEWSINGKESSRLGVSLHHYIDMFMNQETKKDKPTNRDLLEHYNNCSYEIFEPIRCQNEVEWSYFLSFIESNPDKIPYRSEWMVYNEDIKICGTIDMVYENPDGTLNIYDWKRCKNITKFSYGKSSINHKMKPIPDSNYFHYVLQLGLYKFILESKYSKTVKQCWLVKLHPNNRSKTFELEEVVNLGINFNNLPSFTL
jgi:hypothetical protein